MEDPSPQLTSRKTTRTRLACLRCQRRKIRCDGRLPSCGSCSKSRITCLDGSKTDRDLPRQCATSLKERVAWLESIVRARCPDIDLDGGPSDRSDPNWGQGQFNPGAAPATSDSNPVQGDHTGLDTGDDSLGVDHSRNRRASPHEDRRDGPLENWPTGQSEGLAHSIGLLSLSPGTERRYMGPSSAYFFAKLVLACAARGGNRASTSLKRGKEQGRCDVWASTFSLGACPPVPTPLPSSKEQAIQISMNYFDTIHIQYPFLHQPSHLRAIDAVYCTETPNPAAVFQVNMVLSIAAADLSRRLGLPVSGQGFYANAMKVFDTVCIESSLVGLQSLLLLMIHALNDPTATMNKWYLEYQCIAIVTDLGLQRDIKVGNGMSVLEQEMRTRAFHVTYSLDRSLATIMGRPLGLRDEGCELRVRSTSPTIPCRSEFVADKNNLAHGQLPLDVDDADLAEDGVGPRTGSQGPTHMSPAIHLFKLARLNSETKYVLHSISYDAVPYAYPSVLDLHMWQQDLMRRLDEWAGAIPQLGNVHAPIIKICEIRYHEVKILLLRPSPRIPHPSDASLRCCYNSAIRCIALFGQLYRQDSLQHSWTTMHSVFLSVITMLYCIWIVPNLINEIKLDSLISDLKTGSVILSAIGEHWSEAKRSSSHLEQLSSATIRWALDIKARGAATAGKSHKVVEMMPSFNEGTHRDNSRAMPPSHGNSSIETPILHEQQQGAADLRQNLGASSPYTNPDLLSSLFSDYNIPGQLGCDLPIDVDEVFQGLFNELGPPIDYGTERTDGFFY